MDRLVSPAFAPEALAHIFSIKPLLGHSTSISHILTDSRSLIQPEATLFFAIRTESGDGHQYIETLYSAGVRSFVVARMTGQESTRYPGANW